VTNEVYAVLFAENTYNRSLDCYHLTTVRTATVMGTTNTNWYLPLLNKSCDVKYWNSATRATTLGSRELQTASRKALLKRADQCSLMAHIENLWVYPVKGLDRMEVKSIEINEAGTFHRDREYAMLNPEEDSVIEDRFDSVGKTFNGKEIDHTHEVTSSFDPETDELTLRMRETGTTHTFDLTSERGGASEWFSDFVGEPVELRQKEPPSFIDRPKLGPSVISTGTLEEVASWFDDMTVEGARIRLRPNIEIGGVPAFWEDRFLGEDPGGFEVGQTRFEGAEACARCVVPSRDPDTGHPTEDFEQRFAERREKSLPEWAPEEEFEHFFTVMLITRVPESSRGDAVRVGDEVSVSDELEA